ncbi:hypothetical protein ABKV88_06365 [Enterobacter mori]|nr:hypothetical protein [Enterobacter mori]QXM21661.1 hypothetical protein HUI94_15445 [Enterobacter mori]
MSDIVCQLRGRGPRQRCLKVTSRQPLKRGRRRLDTPLQVAARAVFRRRGFVRFSLSRMMSVPSLTAACVVPSA